MLDPFGTTEDPDLASSALAQHAQPSLHLVREILVNPQPIRIPVRPVPGNAAVGRQGRFIAARSPVFLVLLELGLTHEPTHPEEQINNSRAQRGFDVTVRTPASVQVILGPGKTGNDRA